MGELPTCPSTCRWLFRQHRGEQPGVDVSPDGQRFLMIKNAETTDTPASTIVIVQNMLEELKRLVPTN